MATNWRVSASQPADVIAPAMIIRSDGAAGGWRLCVSNGRQTRRKPLRRLPLRRLPLRRLLASLIVLATPATPATATDLAGIPVSGWAVATIDASGRPTARAEGGAELAPDGRIIRPLEPDTPMRVASISKLALALAIHRLADRQGLDLDADASRYLGRPFRHPRYPLVPISVRMLLRHESGLSDAGGYAATLGTRLEDMLGPKAWGPARPGTSFDYANINSAVLATIVEMQTGERFDQAMQRLVFQPLEIRACFNWSACAQGFAASGATLYRKSTDQGESWNPAGPWVAQVDAERPAGGCPVRPATPCDLDTYRPGTNGGLFAPQGGLRISVLELARLGHKLLRNEGAFLKPETHASLFRPMPVKPGGPGEETDPKLMRFWSEGGLHCLSGTGEPGTDQPLAPTPTAGCGHLGEAYGLFSALLMDPSTGTTRAQAMTGSAAKPPPGTRSRFNALEEALFAR
jgi:CubicO group peptidase (beta-lactamase class C family)